MVKKFTIFIAKYFADLEPRYRQHTLESIDDDMETLYGVKLEEDI